MGGLCIITERFGCIITSDVIERLTDPWTSARHMREMLVPKDGFHLCGGSGCLSIFCAGTTHLGGMVSFSIAISRKLWNC